MFTFDISVFLSLNAYLRFKSDKKVRKVVSIVLPPQTGNKQW